MRKDLNKAIIALLWCIEVTTDASRKARYIEIIRMLEDVKSSL